jgi:hypothetical protein
MKLKTLPIGQSDYREIITRNQFYVDKTLFLKELLDSGSLVSLIVRPRRFGKTTNLTMIRYFFEKHPNLENCEFLFQDKMIWKEGSEYTEHCGKYPVVYLTLKDIKESSWENCETRIKMVLSEEFDRHKYLLKEDLIKGQHRVDFENLINRSADLSLYKNALKTLTQFLYNHHKQRVVVLIDEYDTPIHEANERGYYTQIVDFLRSFLGTGLKDNPCIERSVITGILRISKESIFSDLNNFAVFTTLNDKYSEQFGMTEKEVWEALETYGLESYKEGVKDWYNGYVFGSTEGIYNPWSVLNFLDSYKEGLRPHWVNTSSNLLVKKLLTNSDSAAKKDLERLLTGQAIQKEVMVDTVFADVEKNSETLWSYLLFSGYLKVTKQEITQDERLICDLMIPNKEVSFVYRKFISSWLTENLQSTELNLLLKGLLEGDSKTFGKFLKKFVLNSMSYFDPTGAEPEKVYHAFVLGLLLQLSDQYRVQSNRESGYGRYDIMLIPKSHAKNGIIIEFKKVEHDEKETLETAVESALHQIEEKQYESELKGLGISTIFKYGIAFDGKDVLVKMG